MLFRSEHYPLDRTLKSKTGFEEAIKNFWDTLPPFLTPVFLELQMYHKTFNYAGTSDIILYDSRDNSYIIADYKTNKDLFKNYKGQKMLKQFKHLLDNPFNHYQLQLSYYQILFEQTGFNISGRYIIYIKPDGTFERYATEDYTDILIKDLKSK